MNTPKITVLDHTADYLIKIEGESLADLFHGGLRAITSYCTDGTVPENTRQTMTYEFNLTEQTLSDLLIRFLNEMLYAMEEKSAFFYTLTIQTLDNTTITGQVSGVPADSVVKGGEIKAATYHNLTIEQKNNSLTATILFDV